jgi:hypothetical protein
MARLAGNALRIKQLKEVRNSITLVSAFPGYSKGLPSSKMNTDEAYPDLK